MDNQQTQGTPTTDAGGDLSGQYQQKIADLTEAAKRALADLANYKKRVEEERMQFAKFANIGLILEFLPVLDNFKRAFSNIPPELEQTEWVKGVMAIEKQFVEIFKKNGIVEVSSPIGQPFNPHVHEAVIAGPGTKDTVIEELEKGYMLDDKVIRPAKVKVGDGNL